MGGQKTWWQDMPPSWALGGAMAGLPPPPWIRQWVSLHFTGACPDLIWWPGLWWPRVKEPPQCVSCYFSQLSKPCRAAGHNFFSHLLGKTAMERSCPLPTFPAVFPTFPAYWFQVFTNQTETKPSANVIRATLNRLDFGNGNFALANNPNVTLRSMNGDRDITKSCKNAGRPWQR